MDHRARATASDGPVSQMAEPATQDTPSVRRELQPLADGLSRRDVLRLDRRRVLPRDEGDVVARAVLEQGIFLPGGHDAETRLVVGTGDFAVEHGRMQRREPERHERGERRRHGGRWLRIGECTKYGRCVGGISTAGCLLRRKWVETVHGCRGCRIVGMLRLAMFCSLIYGRYPSKLCTGSCGDWQGMESTQAIASLGD